MKIRSPITTQRRWWDFLQPSLDAASVLGSLVAVRWMTGRTLDELSLAMGLVTVVLYLLLSQLTGLNRRIDVGSVDRELRNILGTWAMTVFALALLGFATRYSHHFSRSVVLTWIVLAPTMIGLVRMCLRVVLRALLRHGIGVSRVAIAGRNDLGRQTYTNLVDQPSLGLRVIGFYDDRDHSRDEEPSDDGQAGEIVYPALAGDLSQLVESAHRGELDTVLITLPMRAEDRIRFLLDQLSDTTVSVYIVPDFFVFELLHSRWTSMGGLPAVSVFENPLFGVDGMMKRAADLVIAIAALCVLAVPMVIIAITIKLTSPGSVFFRQRRYGLSGHEILVWKFRSMQSCDDGPVIKQATKDDSRITRIGAVLRRTSLDELPQLFNVIDGSMSLVGPRPHATAHNEQYRCLIRGYMLRHKIKPGITGLAQVNGCRGETETIDKMEARVKWDHNYIRRWSLWLDIKILFKTLSVVWKQEQAH
jgi:putative colanic acid biosynthesis UDP-glucose lipid carrier transferase